MEANTVRAGMGVSDVNGAPVGTVWKVDGNKFQLEDGEGWLSNSAVFKVDSYVTLLCNAEGLAYYRVAPPAQARS